MASEELSPYVYLLLVESVPFQLEITQSKFNFEDIKDPTYLLKYYMEIKKSSLFQIIKRHTICLPFLILDTLKGKEDNVGFNLSESNTIFNFTEKEAEVSEIL